MSGGGIGSASVLLIFAVLGLAIFTVISLVPALNEETLIESEVRLVKAYFAADALAEQVLAELLTMEYAPDKILGVEIISDGWDWDLMAERVSFACPISDTKELYVSVAIGIGVYQILSWRMVATGEWQADDRLNVWQGYEFAW